MAPSLIVSDTLPLLPTLGVPELLIILVIVLLFFGVGKLPQIGTALGAGLQNFKRGAAGDDGEETPTVT